MYRMTALVLATGNRSRTSGADTETAVSHGLKTPHPLVGELGMIPRRHPVLSSSLTANTHGAVSGQT